MKKRRFSAIIFVLVVITSITLLSGCSDNWQERFDTDKPSLTAQDGWTQTMADDFTKFNSIDEVYQQTAWRPSPHRLRRYEYWCDEMIELDSDTGALVIHSEQRNDHKCETCGVSEGIFTSGIETRYTDTNGKTVTAFEQAYGYFEATVKVPRGNGMWSAFWLQSSGTSKIGNQGMDGTEIDIYESSFVKNNPTKTGNALHYDAYNAPYYRMADHVTDVGYNLYDDEFHTYSLYWTPEKYVFYVDNKAVWATDFGGVARVPEFLRLTVEIRDTYAGPYGQVLGTFSNADDGSNDFLIKSVNVWQNESFKSEIKSNDDYQDMKKEIDDRNALFITLGSVGGAIIVIGVIIMLLLFIRKKRKSNIA